MDKAIIISNIVLLNNNRQCKHHTTIPVACNVTRVSMDFTLEREKQVVRNKKSRY